jgi:hypothetical protein
MPILSFDNFKSKADVSLEFTQEEFDYIKSNTKRTVVDVYSAEEVSNWSPFKSKDVTHIDGKKVLIKTIRIRFSVYYDRRHKDQLIVLKERKYIDGKFVTVYNIEGDPTNYKTLEDLIKAIESHILTWRITIFVRKQENTNPFSHISNVIKLLDDYSVIRDNKVSEFRFRELCDELEINADNIIKHLKDYEVEFSK